MTKLERKEFGILNVVVSKSKGEVRIWGCDPKTGQCMFRLKALGNVHAATIDSIVVKGVLEVSI